MEQEVKCQVQQELQRASCYAAMLNPLPPNESDSDEDVTAGLQGDAADDIHVSGGVFQRQPYTFNNQLKP
jgi:hypothetical protein